jgi:LPXTG-site transpeptidase (sortase) family protein
MGGDTNGVFDIFVRELDTDAPLVASTNLSAAYTSTGPSSFAVTFSEAVNNAGGGTGTDDAANPNNYVVLEQGSVSGFQTTACNNINTTQDTRVTPSGVTYIPNTAIVNFGSPLPAGTYRLFVCGTTSIVDLAGNALAGDGTNSGTDFTFDFTVGAADPPPTVPSHTLQAAYTSTGPSSFTVTFSENVSNVGGGAGTDDAANPNNYVLMEQGSVSGFQTTACNNINATQDTRVTPSGVTYIPNTAIVNLGSALPVGSYRLFVCGTTSIIDLAGNHLNNGVDFTFDFSVAAAAVVNPPSAVTSSESRNANGRNSGNRWLPNTGFVPNVVTRLPEQPVELVYTKMSDLWLEIPSQKVKANIVGVPQSENAWDVKWLGNDTGWLNGTAFPSWEGNSVLTGHVMGADGLPGPFAKLQDLKYGERIIVHILDQQYVFEVRNKRLVRPDSTAFAFEHLEDASYLTLITCSGYNEEKNTYSFRRLVRAVLVEIK